MRDDNELEIGMTFAFVNDAEISQAISVSPTSSNIIDLLHKTRRESVNVFSVQSISRFV